MCIRDSTEGLPGGDAFRDALNVLSRSAEQLAAGRTYFSQLADDFDRVPLTAYTMNQPLPALVPLH